MQAETDAYIIERVKAALYVLKNCESETARIEYGILLAALAPERLAMRDPKGMIRKVAERLGVQRGDPAASTQAAFIQPTRPPRLDPAASVSTLLPQVHALTNLRTTTGGSRGS